MEPRTPRRLVLDHLEPIQVDADRPPIDNLHGLLYLPHGLHWLASGVRKDEIAKAQEFSAPLFAEWTFEMSDPRVAMRANAFCWFAVSLVSYVRSVALLGLMDSEGWTLRDLVANRRRVKAHCDEYADALIPEVVRTRHKIGAHFAATAPRSDDNVGMLEASLLQPVMYRRPYFWAGSYWQGTTPEEQVEEHPWALTEVFERLVPRYWPTASLPPLPTGEG